MDASYRNACLVKALYLDEPSCQYRVGWVLVFKVITGGFSVTYPVSN